MIVQTENERLVRDTNSRAISPKREELIRFREKRSKQLRIDNMDQRIGSLESAISNLDQKMNIILELLSRGNENE